MRWKLPHTRTLVRALVGGYAIMALAIIVIDVTGCGQAPAEVPRIPVAEAKEQTSASCRDCHAEIYAAWSGTDHALANRMVDAVHDHEALASFHPPVGVGSGEPLGMILGHKPLWQPLIPGPGGRWQPHELAYDPAKKEWFNVFGDEHREPGEWGHWTGRGMNWNSQCAQCHMTGYEKKYNAVLDTYRSTWVEQGISCIQCHGPMPSGHGAAKSDTLGKAPPPFHGNRHLMMETCAPCHARNEPLTNTFQPGDQYADHYRITLPTDAATFYPDGQQRDEDFNWTSVLLSRMGHAGVTCLDCHDPHTTKTILPVTNNQLCLQCHASPGRVLPSGVRAVVIDPVAHSHHAEGSAGNSCVACHMPTRTYMKRSPRHDHGWLKPDPLLTKELGIPNACANCHADQSVDWAIAKTDAWFGAKMESRQRARTRAVAAARTGKPDASVALLDLLKDEDIPAWRATMLTLLTPYLDQTAVITTGRASLSADDPLERSAAVRLLSGTAGSESMIRPFLKDPVRLVRLDAEWALSRELTADSPERKELDAYLTLSLDQPAGRLRMGQDLANRGDLAGADQQMTLAEKWDPNSPGILATHAQVLIAQGRTAEAAVKLRRASDLTPGDSQLAMQSALAFAEVRRFSDAESALRQAVQRDSKFDRAWYNLGLLLAQSEQLPAAADALSKAQSLAPQVPDYPYALATVLLRLGDQTGARSAAQRTLKIAPQHRAAQQILRSLK